MSTMTAYQLHLLTRPLFVRHPSARPSFLDFHPGDGVKFKDAWTAEQWGVCDAGASLIIQAHLLQWLADNSFYGQFDILQDRRTESASGNRTDARRYRIHGHYGPTMLHALVAACLAVDISTEGRKADYINSLAGGAE